MKNVFLIVLLLNSPFGGWGACNICNPPAPLIAITPASEDNSYQSYLTRANFYHFLKYNHSFRASNAEFNDWYNDMTATSNLGFLETAQERLYNGNFQGARELLDGLTADNDIEGNDISYYNLYANYLQAINEAEVYAPDDSTALATLANLCPAEYGTSVFKARALYNSIYNAVMLYEDCNAEETGERLALSNSKHQPLNSKQADWNVELYPNPTNNRVTIRSNNERDNLTVRVCDLTGRVVVLKQLKTENFIASMDFDLINGAYITTITNEQHQTITKKLLIAK